MRTTPQDNFTAEYAEHAEKTRRKNSRELKRAGAGSSPGRNLPVRAQLRAMSLRAVSECSAYSAVKLVKFMYARTTARSTRRRYCRATAGSRARARPASPAATRAAFPPCRQSAGRGPPKVPCESTRQSRDRTAKGPLSPPVASQEWRVRPFRETAARPRARSTRSPRRRKGRRPLPAVRRATAPAGANAPDVPTRAGPLLSHRVGDAEVRDPPPAVAVDEKVLRFQVTVDDPVFVRNLEAVENAVDLRRDLGERPRAVAAHEIGHGALVFELHDVPVHIALRIPVVDRHDRRMLEPRRELRLATEPRHRFVAPCVTLR